MESCCQKGRKSRYLTRNHVVVSYFRHVILAPVYLYRYLISPLLGPRCRFEPSCSVYAIEAVQQLGVIKGLTLSLKRISKCHPWHAGGYDPIPNHKKPIQKKL